MGRSKKTALLLVLIGVFIYSTAIAGILLTPAEAMQINKGWLLQLRQYRHYHDNEYGASSDYAEMEYGDGVNKVNLSVYISGTENSVNKLWLMLNVFGDYPRLESQKVFSVESQSLFSNVFNKEIPEHIKVFFWYQARPAYTTITAAKLKSKLQVGQQVRVTTPSL